MKSAKIGTIFLVVLLALGGVGASYAAWQDDVNINGTVTTGNIDVKFSDYGPYVYYFDAHNNDPVEDTDGDYATVQYQNNYKTLHVTISDAYPWLSTLIKVEVTNHGSVDAALNDIIFSPADKADQGFGLAQPYLRKLNVGIVDGTTVVGGVGVTLEEGLVVPAGETMSCWLVVHVLGDAPQNTEYNFDVTFEWIQAQMYGVDTGDW